MVGVTGFEPMASWSRTRKIWMCGGMQGCARWWRGRAETTGNQGKSGARVCKEGQRVVSLFVAVVCRFVCRKSADGEDLIVALGAEGIGVVSVDTECGFHVLMPGEALGGEEIHAGLK